MSAVAAALEQVGPLLREVAARVVMPRFGALCGDDVQEKAPGELVTVVDREAEALLSDALSQLLPGSRVVGEERVASEPALLQGLEQGDVWLIDPLDGTANFIAGSSCFAIMVALLREGETVAGFMLDPTTNLLARAERGGGAYLESERLWTDDRPAHALELRGAVLRKYMPPPLRAVIEPRLARLGQVLPGLHCAGAEYPSIVGRKQDFAMFWRTLPWDHAPGTLFVEEAGGRVARYDGAPYQVWDRATGLLVARSREAWEVTQRALLDE